MKIKKINSDEVLDVTIKEVRLPNLDECYFIDRHSLSYGRDGILYHAFFKEFIRDEEKFYESCDEEYQPVYGDLMDCGGIYDFIPVIEIEEKMQNKITIDAYYSGFPSVFQHSISEVVDYVKKRAL